MQLMQPGSTHICEGLDDSELSARERDANVELSTRQLLVLDLQSRSLNVMLAVASH